MKDDGHGSFHCVTDRAGGGPETSFPYIFDVCGSGVRPECVLEDRQRDRIIDARGRLSLE